MSHLQAALPLSSPHGGTCACLVPKSSVLHLRTLASLSCSMFAFFLKKIYVLIWKAILWGERERERLIHVPSAGLLPIGQDQAKARILSSLWVSHGGARAPGIWVCCCFSAYVSCCHAGPRGALTKRRRVCQCLGPSSRLMPGEQHSHVCC